MKFRIIEDLHDKYIGHKKFAKVCDLLIERNFKITEIKEYNEKFKFKVDGYDAEYSKNWKSSAKEYVDYLINIISLKMVLKNLKGEQK